MRIIEKTTLDRLYSNTKEHIRICGLTGYSLQLSEDELVRWIARGKDILQQTKRRAIADALRQRKNRETDS